MDDKEKQVRNHVLEMMRKTLGATSIAPFMHLAEKAPEGDSLQHVPGHAEPVMVHKETHEIPSDSPMGHELESEAEEALHEGPDEMEEMEGHMEEEPMGEHEAHEEPEAEEVGKELAEHEASDEDKWADFHKRMGTH